MSTLLVTTFLCVVAVHPQDGSLNRASLMRVLRGMYEQFHDVEFVYEGYTRFIGKSNDPKIKEVADKDFQGVFAFRRDGSAHDDNYRHYVVEGRTSRRIQLHVDGKVVKGSLTTSQKSLPVKPAGRSGSIGSIAFPGSPLRIFFIPRLVFSDPPYEGMAVEDLGWDHVGDNRSRKIQFSDGGRRLVYWFDFEHGGNPRKFEYYFGGQLAMSCTDIRIEKFSTEDGSTFWLPVEGRCLTYGSVTGPPGTLSASPTHEEYYSVVDGTVRFNQDLPDRRFRFDWATESKSPLLARSIRQFEEQERRLRGLSTSDVEQRIDTLLEKADQQSEQLLASQGDAGGLFGLTGSIRVALLSVGITLLVIIGYRKFANASRS